ncbi:hypothetical protein GM415_17290 [Pseudodesulfovibrio cashew]|uniref:PilZ domain-containing protein n=1 Tax=Pseudodesulfovibrio cashew TaxID=2678688 RepID=A0A6I6JLC3_9BACT|nr:PilZ domain-containing protein [Pseudodesulfovibrio cashew]QGY41800.1 hypothetical protein GM415_17290 [Pseudodesulfovibrio cashew]
MERRMRPRISPVERVLAILEGQSAPEEVVDFSASGIRVTNGNRLPPGRRLWVDLIINEELCACGIPGTVRWARGTTAGIDLKHADELQMQCCRNMETRLMCR